MRRLLLSLLLLVAAAGVVASEEKDKHLQAAYALLDTMEMDVLMQKSIEQTLELQLQQNPQLAPYKGTMLAFLTKQMSYESLKDEFAAIYAEAFTRKELKKIRKFYETPVGKKTIRTLPELMNKGARIGAERVRANMGEFQEMMRLETERLQKDQVR